VAKFIVPDWGDKVDFGIGLSYRPTKISADEFIVPDDWGIWGAPA
jgi:hypothetical protein